MELSWLMRLRIAAAVATGIVLIGILGWPLAQPHEPLGVVSLSTGSITLGDAITSVFLASLAGLIAYFLSWPFGRQIAPLAAPSGLAIWAVRSGNIANLMQLNSTLNQRQAILTAFKWEPIFWLAVVAAGFAGVLLGEKISQGKTMPNEPAKKPDSKPYSYLTAALALVGLDLMVKFSKRIFTQGTKIPGSNLGSKAKPNKPTKKPNSNSYIYLSAALALVGSVLIAQFCIRILAQDVKIPDSNLGSVVAQPAVGQIVFAVLVSFGLAAFIFKKFFNASYIWPTIASAFVISFVSTTYVRQDVLQYLVAHWPAVFFHNPVTAILPVQMVAFGTLGAIVGYWLAVRYDYWREHESK